MQRPAPPALAQRLAPWLLALLLAACASPRAPSPRPSTPSRAATVPIPAGPVTEVDRRAAALVVAAMAYLDTPYRLGGNSAEQGFDCSGFTRHLFARELGLQLPRRSAEQARYAGLLIVERDQLAPGDLVFFNTLGEPFSHVGVYIGDGRFVHAPRTGSAIRTDDLGSRWWSQRFEGGRRAAALDRAS